MVDLIHGKYQIVREIARSNDIVYEARDVALGRRVAVKILNFPPSLTPQARRERIERFNREARAAGRLTHPNIVSVYEYGEENGNYFIAMEYLDGQTIADRIRSAGALPIHEVVELGCQVLDALFFAHTNNVIHRDIKPDNIFYLSSGVVKLTDFGIARITEDQSLTAVGQVFGTPSYMSPEQIHGGQIDNRSDIFSVGVLLYEMLTGYKPFNGDSIITITYAVMNANPAPMIGVPSAIEQVIQKALQKNPLYRYPDARQMQTELRSAMNAPIQRAPTNMGMPPQITGSWNQWQNPGVQGAPNQYPPQMSPAGYGNSTGQYGVSQPSYAPGTYQPAAFDPVTGQPIPQNQPPPAWAVPARKQQWSPPPVVIPLWMKRLGLTLLLIVLSGVIISVMALLLVKSYNVSSSQANVQKLNSTIAEANKDYNSGDYADAAKLLKSALTMQPDPKNQKLIDTELGYIYVELARQEVSQQNIAQAISYYQEAIKYNPDYGIAHSELANLLSQSGHPQQARVEQSLSTQSSNDKAPPNSINSLPDSSVQNGTALTPQQLLQQKGDEAEQYLEAGNAAYQSGDTETARQDWEQAYQDAPTLQPGIEAQQYLTQLDNEQMQGSSGQ